jgi:hypothetical protein
MEATRYLSRLAALVLMLAVGLAACGDSTDPEPEPEVATLRLLIGAAAEDTVLVDIASGDVTGGPITISADTDIRAEFLRDDGSTETLVTAADFRLDVTSANESLVTFTRTSAFAGTLHKVAIGGTSLTFALFHLEEQHNEFSRSVAITVS